MPALVSVIIPTYNRASLLPVTLESVLCQTHTNIEVIVVDDGSTDETAALMSTITDQRVRYIRNKWTGHPSPNRNTGILAARGDLLAFVDSDDLWEPEKLEQQVAYMQQDASCLWCFCHYSNFSSDGNGTTECPIDPPAIETTYPPETLLKGNFIGSPTVLARKKIFDMVGLFNETDAIRFVEDWELWLRFSAIQPGAFLPQPLALYRLHAQAATTEPDPYEAAERCLNAIQEAVRVNPDVYGDHYNEAVESVITHIVKRLLFIGEHDKAKKICRKARCNPLKAKKMTAMYALSFLPIWGLQGILRINRSIKKSLACDQED